MFLVIYRVIKGDFVEYLVAVGSTYKLKLIDNPILRGIQAAKLENHSMSILSIPEPIYYQESPS